MFSRIAMILLCVWAGVTCAMADDKAAANKIFVETVQLLKQAAAAKPSDAVGLYEKALRNLDSIVANYPSSDLAVQIISGQAIGQVSRIGIEKALNEARQTTKELEKKGLEKNELEKLRGTWQVSKAIEDGKSVPEEERKAMKIVFSDDTMKLSNPVGNREIDLKFKLNPAQKPKAIDIVGQAGPFKGEAAMGIYELDGDTLTLCIETTERPKECKAPQGLKLVLVLKRSKS
jgi:uncharacterized protein (TIGR03067 family)